MGKVEAIRQVLTTSGDLSCVEEATQSLHLRRGSGYYRAYGFRVAPEKPLLTVHSLRKFSGELVRQLITVGPRSISWCSIFSGKREAVRMAALYFCETDKKATYGMETRIRVSVFPCRVMAQNVGYRGIIEIGGYNCPEPCEFAPKCTFKASKWRTLRKLL